MYFFLHVGIVFQLVFTVFIVLGVIWAIEFTLCGVKKLEGYLLILYDACVNS